MKLVDPKEQIVYSVGNELPPTKKDNTDHVVVTNRRIYHYDKNGIDTKGTYKCINIEDVKMVRFSALTEVKVKTIFTLLLKILFIFLVFSLVTNTLSFIIIYSSEIDNVVIALIVLSVLLGLTVGVYCLYVFLLYKKVGFLEIEYGNGNIIQIHLKVKNESVLFHIGDAIFSVQDIYNPIL